MNQTKSRTSLRFYISNDTKSNNVLNMVFNKRSILMIIVILTKLTSFFIMFSLDYQKIITICDCINIISTIIAWIILIINTNYVLVVKWVIYLIYFINQIIVSFIIDNNDEENKTCQLKDSYSVVVSYLISNLYIPNSLIFIMQNSIKIKKRVLKTHLLILVLLNIIILIIVNLTQGRVVIYDSITFSYSLIVTYCVYYRIHITNKEKSTKDKKRESMLDLDGYDINSDYEEMNTIYGSCIANKFMMIKKQNKYFNVNMKDFSIKRNSILPSHKDIMDDHQSIKTTSHHCSGVLISVSNAQLPLNNNDNLLFIDYENIFLKEDNEEEVNNDHNNNNSNRNRLNLYDIFTMKDNTNEHSPLVLRYSNDNKKQSNFITLGKFVFLSFIKGEMYYEIHCRNVTINNSNKKKEPLYEFIFYELTNFMQKNRIQIEKKYKSLLLRKINHEFKVPIVLIQNLTNEINETTTSVYTKSIVKTIKYVTEIILLLVSDLNEYIHLNSLTIEDKEIKAESGNVDLVSFYEDIKNISFVYLKVYNTNVSIQYDFHQKLRNCSIAINEIKLKQILSIIIINAIKNSTNVLIKLNAKDNNQLSYLKHNSNHIQLKTQQINSLNVFSKPLLFNGDSIQDYKLSISIEDNGPGIDHHLINCINSFNINDQFNLHSFQDFLTDEYKDHKSFGTGLMICLKLCKDLGIFLQCELVNENSTVKGSRFTLDIDYKITFEEGRNENDSCINENEIESNCGLTNQSLITKKLDLEELIFTLNDKQHFLSSSLNNINAVIQTEGNDINQNSKRKSKTSLYFKSNKSKFATQALKEEIGFVQCSQNSFSIMMSSLSPYLKKKVSKNYQDTDIPLFNDCDKNFSCSIDKCLSSSLKKRLSLFQRNDSNQIMKAANNETNSVQAIDNKRKNRLSHLCILNELKEQSRNHSSHQVISLFTNNYELLHARKQKSYDSIVKEDLKSNASSEHIDKNLIVIVDDIDSNKKAIYSMVTKHLTKKNKGDLYDYRLLSDGIELVNLFYTDSITQSNLIKIIFCDEAMNFMNGSESFMMIKKIAAVYNIKTIPFVLCSAFCDNSFKEKMISIGINNVYGKPLQSSAVERIIEEFNL